MTRHRGTRTCPAWLAPWLIVAALLLRVAVPAGWMPAETGFGILPCAGSGPMPLAATAAHRMQHDHGGRHDKGQAQPCPFAPFSAAAAAPPPPLPAAPSALAAAVLPIIASIVAVGRGLAAPSPPATGPPTPP